MTTEPSRRSRNIFRPGDSHQELGATLGGCTCCSLGPGPSVPSSNGREAVVPAGRGGGRRNGVACPPVVTLTYGLALTPWVPGDGVDRDTAELRKALRDQRFDPRA